MTNSQSDFPLNDQNFQADLLKIKKVFADLITQASDGKIPIRSSHVHGLHHFEELYIRARAGMWFGPGISGHGCFNYLS